MDDPSLSRLHALIVVGNDGQLSIDDLGSTNGVFVNGTEQLSTYLMLGDVVRFGRVEYVVGGRSESEVSSEAPVASQTILRRVAMSQKPKIDQLALEGLLATSREMMTFEDLPGLLERVLDRLSSIVKPDRAAILLVDAETGAIVPRAVRPSGAYLSVSEFASSTVVRQAMTARDVFIVHDIRTDPRLQQAASVLAAGVRSVICVPLLGRSGPIGVLYADKLGVEQFAPDLADFERPLPVTRRRRWRRPGCTTTASATSERRWRRSPRLSTRAIPIRRGIQRAWRHIRSCSRVRAISRQLSSRPSGAPACCTTSARSTCLMPC